MSKIELYFVNNSYNSKEKLSIIKPLTYQELIKQLSEKFPKISKKYEIFCFDKKNNNIKITNEETYKLVEDILFIRELDKKTFKLSLFEKNYKKLSESKKEKLEENYNCKICSSFIKYENPFLCYKCQTIFHEKCLKEWDNKCRSLNKILSCPNCRNELALEHWQKKLNYEENRTDNAKLINKINQYKNDKLLRNNLSSIKDNKILLYQKYIEEMVLLFKTILSKINSLHNLFKLNKNKNLENLINNYNNYSENIDNLNIKFYSKVITEELDMFIYCLKNNKKLDVIKRIITNNQKLNCRNNIDNNLNKSDKVNINNDNNKKTIIELNNVKKNNFNNFINIKSKRENENINNKINNNNIKEKKSDILLSNNIYKNSITIKYFVKSKGNYNIFGSEFVENNKENINLIINGKNTPLIDNYQLKDGENSITIIIKNNLTNLSYMFSWCNSLVDINELKYLNVQYSKDFSYMFCGCSSLSNINSLQNWNVSSGTNFTSMFCNCSNLLDIKPLQKWNVSNGVFFQYMFYGCSLLEDLNPIKNWNVSNGNNFENMFFGCSSKLDIKIILSGWKVDKEKLKKLL